MLFVLFVCFFCFFARVVIRGEPSEDAVLCTDDKSYELRLADTSNALLISPSMLLPKNRGDVTKNCFK